MRPVRRTLVTLISVLALMIAGTLIAVKPASAKLGPISIQSVWVGNSWKDHRTVLNSNQTAKYNVAVDNTTTKTIVVDVEFEVYQFDEPSNYDYYYTAKNVKLAPGLSWYYSPSFIPVDATTGDYTARISVVPTNSGSPSDEGDWAEADFHIFSLSVSPVNDAIKALQDLGLCLADIFSDGSASVAVKTINKTAPYYAIFEDVETGNLYKAGVTLIPGGDCISFVLGAHSLFSVYKMVLQ